MEPNLKYVMLIKLMVKIASSRRLRLTYAIASQIRTIRKDAEGNGHT
jgi:hypothetical protein